jgi:hypothetical protein
MFIPEKGFILNKIMEYVSSNLNLLVILEIRLMISDNIVRNVVLNVFYV